MRRNVSAILLLTVFLSLQFGKVASYIYCKWQAEIIQNNPDCGCDDHLTSMFEHNDDDSKNNLSKNTLNEKLNEFTPKSFINIPQIVLASSNCFTEYNAELSESVIDSPFHPPIA
jgi:tRNA G37 N-methylase Trm5